MTQGRLMGFHSETFPEVPGRPSPLSVGAAAGKEVTADLLGTLSHHQGRRAQERSRRGQLRPGESKAGSAAPFPHQDPTCLGSGVAEPINTSFRTQPCKPV